jgi:hypothetical protein
MTLLIYSWCSFTTITLFWLSKSIPNMACDILDETSNYLYFFLYRFLLCILSVFWNGTTSVSHGTNLALRQFTTKSPDNYTRALRRAIKFRGLTTLYRIGVHSDKYLTASGSAFVYVFLPKYQCTNAPDPIGEKLLNRILDSGVKPIHEWTLRKLNRIPDGFITRFLCFMTILLVFARIGFTVYGRILGVRLGIINVRSLGKRKRKLSGNKLANDHGFPLGERLGVSENFVAF